MAQEYYTILTDTGLAYEAQCKAERKPISLSWMAVGDGNGDPYDPTPDATQLRRETHRQPLNALQQDEQNPSWYMAEALLPEDVGGWTIREVGIYTDTGILYAIGRYPASVKPLLPSGSTKQFYVRAIFQLSNTAEVTLIVDNNVVAATRAFVLHHVKTEMDRRHMDVLKVLDASGGMLDYPLPDADETLGIVDIIVRRRDNSGHSLRISATGANKIKIHTHLNPDGYPFIVLMGAGDWWHLRSDGVGNWWPIGRHDSTPLGRPVFDTTMLFSPGGYGALNGALLSRSQWPWLWDHAQQSDISTSEADRAGMEGGWTTGDGQMTFRGPEGRGEFLRIWDESRNVDANRRAGSYAPDMIKSHTHGIPQNADEFGWGYATTGGGPQFTTSPTEPTGGHETRPRSIAYPGRIKLI